MAKSNPTDVINAYRRRQERRFPFTFADISKGLIFLITLGASLYVAFIGRPELPVLVELKTNTPTFTPSITPTASPTATITQTPTDTPDPKLICDCPSPQIIVVTATMGATEISVPPPMTTAFTSTATLSPTDTSIPTETLTPTASPTATPTQILYIVRKGDTLSSIALRFGVTVEAIQEINNLDSTLIFIGQTLQIPHP